VTDSPKNVTFDDVNDKANTNAKYDNAAIANATLTPAVHRQAFERQYIIPYKIHQHVIPPSNMVKPVGNAPLTMMKMLHNNHMIGPIDNKNNIPKHNTGVNRSNRSPFLFPLKPYREDDSNTYNLNRYDMVGENKQYIQRSSIIG
jgi:hypothetical protein